MSLAQIKCVVCSSFFPIWELRYTCVCGGLLEVDHSQEGKAALPALAETRLQSRKTWDKSGVWRFREAVIPLEPLELVTHQEGQTGLYDIPELCRWTGSQRLLLKHEGENPSGSFKDRGMTAAVSVAKKLGMRLLACASTGNTSSSLAAYAARAGLRSLVFLPAGKVSLGKMAQTLGYGAHAIAVKGDFDDAMRIVRELAEAGEVYMVNSLNPFRIEGQKTIIWELLQDLDWDAPDWILVPGGNLGNTSAFGKAIEEAFNWGWIKKKPRLASIQAHGANPFYLSYQSGFQGLEPMQAETIATAIRIGNPVNYSRAIRAIQRTQGLVAAVSDEDLLSAKAAIDRAGVGCEPASAVTLAGLKELIGEGKIRADERVVAILTGHMLKDTDAIFKSQDLACHEVEANKAAITLAIQQFIGT